MLGKGFVLSPEEAGILIKKDPRNKDVLFPYLNGDDLNNHPEQKPSRWVINFFDWTEEKARTYPYCFEIVEQRVKSERIKLDEEKNSTNKQRKKYWWRFGSDAKNLYMTISQLDQVMAISEVTKYVNFAFVPTEIVFMHTLKIIAFSDWINFSILSSSLYNEWAWKYSSTMGGTTLRFTPSTAFETFPFPPHKLLYNLNIIGNDYYNLRLEIMKNAKIGFTKLYNLFHDKKNGYDMFESIQRLRDFQIQIDLAVLSAYGWDDISLKHDFYEIEYLPEKDRRRFTINADSRKEILARLLKFNYRIKEDQDTPTV